MLFPHFQRPLPSATIARFERRPGRAPPPGGDQIPAETPVRAVAPGWELCRFVTVYPVTLWPLEVTAARLITDRIPLSERRTGDRALLELSLRCDAPGGFGRLGLESLGFHLGGEDRVGYVLHELFGTAVSRVVVRVGPEGKGARVELPSESVQLVGFDAKEGLFPYPAHAPRGYRLIQEYLAFPKKFLFVDLVGLEGTRSLGEAAEVEILFFLDRGPMEMIPVGPENFLLGCTPLINLFPAPAVPIRLTGARAEYAVVPDVPERHRAEVYSIQQVVGAGSMLEMRVEYRPFYALRHDDRDSEPPAYWYARRRPSPRKDDLGTEVDLAFVDPGFNPLLPSSDMVSASLVCTNRDHPVGMPIGRPAGDLEPLGPIASGRITCLAPMSAPIRPPLARDAQWRLISNLSLNYLSLVDLPIGDGSRAAFEAPGRGRDALVGLLETYDFSRDEAVLGRIAGISSVSSRRVLGRTGRQSMVGGVEVTVGFDESKYVGGSAFLLACVLERFLALQVTINSFSQLIAVGGRGEVIKRWRPRVGEKTLL